MPLSADFIASCLTAISFTLFQLVIQRFLFYHYCAPLLGFHMGLWPLFIFNLTYGGLALGMLCGLRSAALLKRHPALPYAAAGLHAILGGALISLLRPSNGIVVVALAFFALAPSFFWGVQFTLYRGLSKLQFLVSQCAGMFLGIASYNQSVAHLPFSGAFAVLGSLPLLGAVARKSLSWRSGVLAALALIGAALASLRLPQRAILARSFSPLGVIEVSSDGWMITDKVSSPTRIARKGDPLSIDQSAKFPYSIRRPRSVLVVGAGGGQDVAAALLFGASRVDGIDLDAARVRLMRERFAAFSNGLYQDPRVRIIVDEARHALRKMGNSYDLIVVQRPLTRNLYDGLVFDFSRPLLTANALRRYWSRLTPGGMVYFAIPYIAGYPDDRNGASLVEASLRSVFPDGFLARHLAVMDFRSAMGVSKPFRVLGLLLSKPAFSIAGGPKLKEAGVHIVYFPGQSGPKATGRLYGRLFKKRHQPEVADDYFPFPMVSRPSFLVHLLLAGIFLVALLVFFAPHGDSLRRAPTIYVVLGAAYFWLEAFLVLQCSFFFGNAVSAFEWVVASFALSGALAYRHSYSIGGRKVVVSAMVILASLLAAIWHARLLWDKPWGPLGERLVAASICAAVGYLAALPFGYFVSGEEEAIRPCAWDSLGALMAYPALLLILGNQFMGALLRSIIITYAVVALYAACCPRIMRGA